MKLSALAFIFLAFAITSASFAQEETANTSANLSDMAEASVSNTDAATQTAGTLSTKAENKRSPWVLNLRSENYISAQSRADLGDSAPMISLNAVGAIYKASSTTQYELRQYFQHASNIENLSSARARKLHENNWEVSNLAFLASTKLFSIGSSKPISVEAQYYAPTDHLSRSNQENGLLRADGSVTWELSPKWSLSLFTSARFLFNSSENPNAAKGSDAEYYRLITAPIASYNFNDKWAAYYAYNLDLSSTQAQRGNWTPDYNNTGGHEIGFLISWGPVTFNPYLYSDVSLNNGDSALFTEGSRAFTDETNYYFLTVLASF